MSPGEITSLLSAIGRGEPGAEDDLVMLVYPDFRLLAGRHMRQERPDHTLQPTALVNEAWVRLMRGHEAEWKCRAHFFAAASIAMRRVLVDHARQRAAGKRPSGQQRIELNEFLAAASPSLDHILILDEALSELSRCDARQARVVEMIYFGGLSENEVAVVLEISGRTVRRDWRTARAWLQTQLSAHTP